MQRYNRLKFMDKREFLDSLCQGFEPNRVGVPGDLRVVTLGSCFAQNLHHALTSKGISSYFAGFSEEVNSPILNAVLLEEAIHGTRSPHHAEYVELTRHEWYPGHADEQEKFTRLVGALRSSNNVILTLGLGLLWMRLSDGRATLLPDFKNIRNYATRYVLPDAQARHIIDIVETIRLVNPDTNIVISLSPVPLQMSSANPSVVQADCISKSILRVAVQLVMEKGLKGVWYFPSFEFFRWYSGHVPEAAFGTDGNPRHPSGSYVALVIDQFLSTVVQASAADEPHSGPEERLTR